VCLHTEELANSSSPKRIEKRYYSLASGAVATMRLLGQMLSMAIATVVLSLIIGHQAITPKNYQLFLHSIHIIFLIAALLCLSGVYFSWFRGTMLQPGSSVRPKGLWDCMLMIKKWLIIQLQIGKKASSVMMEKWLW